MKLSRNILFSIIVGISILLAGIFAVYSFERELQRPKLAVLGRIQPFELVDADGKSFGLRNLFNRVWIASFFFTTCSDICPVMSKNMGALSRTFEAAPSIKMVSITVNPENDTTERLKLYAEKFDARGNWHFLTGTREAISELAVNSFKLGSIEEPIFHSSYFTLVDRNGYIRGYYDGTKTEELNRLFRDASKLLKER